MSHFRPKEVFRQAKEAEKAGDLKSASASYASLSIYLRRKQRLDDSLTLIDRAIRLLPKSPRLYVQQALSRAAKGDAAGASESVEKFSQLVVGRARAEEYERYLETAFRDHPVLREIFYNKLITLDRTGARPFLALVDALRQQGKLDEARSALIDAFKTKTADDRALFLLEEVLAEQGLKDSIERLRSFEAGKLSREDLITVLSGASKAATPAASASEPPRPALQETAGTDGGDGGAKGSGGTEHPEEKNLHSLIRDLEVEIGVKLDDAVDKIEPLVREFRRRSQKILAGDSKARIDMALAFFEMGLIDDARDELKPIVSTDPYYSESQALLGEILFAEGSDLGALEAFQNCLRDERASVEMIREAKYKLLQIYYRLGDLKQAISVAMELEKLVPDYRDLRFIKMRIQEALGVEGQG